LVQPRNQQAEAEVLLRDVLTVGRVVRQAGFVAGCSSWLAELLPSAEHAAGSWAPGTRLHVTTHGRLHREGAHSPARQMKTNPSWSLLLHQLSATRYFMP